MTNKPLRNLLCAAAVAVTWAFSLPGQAAYDLGWDPGFAGNVVIDFNASCVHHSSIPSLCNSISVLSVDFTDNLGRDWGSNPQTGVTGLLFFNNQGGLIGIDLIIANLILESTIMMPAAFLQAGPSYNGGKPGNSGPCGDDVPTLSFGYVPSFPTNPFVPPGQYVNFNCDGGGGGSAGPGQTTITQVAAQVPEPGTLALLGLGLIGLAAARRRLR